jgi:hypothetical protein
VLGSTVIVIHSPKEEEVESLSELLTKLQDPGEWDGTDLSLSWSHVLTEWLVLLLHILEVLVSYLGSKASYSDCVWGCCGFPEFLQAYARIIL